MLPDLLTSYSKILTECAVAEPLRRLPDVTLHPTLFNTPLIYQESKGREAMRAIYEGYLNIAKDAALPILLNAPTWRLDRNRVSAAAVPSTINSDAVAYLDSIRKGSTANSPVAIGALIGPANDCYRPDLALSATEAEHFHRPQIDELSATSADFLLAQTIPSLEEARGLARALSEFGKPYIISFCTGTNGFILDGTPLPKAFRELDEDPQIVQKPIGYFVNCTHPNFHNHYTPSELDRLIGIQANGSSKDVSSLDSACKTIMDPIDEWAQAMLTFHKDYQVPILGGCCGTSTDHLKALTLNL